MKRAILVAASECNYDHLSSCARKGFADLIIAIDAGYEHLQKCSLIPDIVLGDFDSLGYRPKHDHIISYPSKKDKSDLELAFDKAEELQVEEIYVYGALGGRLDHTLASISVSAGFSKKGMKIHLIDNDCAVTFLAGLGELSFEPNKQGIVSVFALGENVSGLTIEGLLYEVNDIELDCFTSRGLSNEFVGKPVRIALLKGVLCIIHPLAVL